MPTSPLSNLSWYPSESRTLLQRIETTTSPTADLITEFESAKRKLRAAGLQDDVEILEALQAAANEAEDRTNRTLRASVTRKVYYRGFAYLLNLPLPPAQSITSVKYYDPDDTLQTMSSGDYELLVSTRGPGRIQWKADYSFPNINTDRVDPVEVTCVTGFGDADTIPAEAKMAVKLLCEANFDGHPLSRDEAYRLLEPLVFRGTV